MIKVTVKANGQVIVRRSPFRPSDRLAVFSSADTLVVKRLRPPAKLSDIALRAPGRATPLRAIVREIHRYRRELTR